jgi:DNA polymerase III subunit beta
MKVVCTQENLRNGLQVVGRIISSSNTLPILNSVLLKTENGQLKLSTTNLELAINTVIRCKVEQEGSVSVPAKTLGDLINNLPNTNITLEAQDTEVAVSTEHYNTKLKTLPSEEFPLIPVVENGQTIEFKPDELKQALDSVIFSASTSETQPEISGVYLHGSGGLKLVATDRYRLAEKTLTENVSLTGVIIPQKTAVELSRIISGQTQAVKVMITENQISVTADETQLISRLIDGQYPDYQQIIPEEFASTITVGRAELAAALKTSSIFSRVTGSITMKYEVENQMLRITAVSHDVGESTIDLNVEITGESGNIILNFRYVLDALNSMSAENVVIKVVNESAPVIFVPQGDNSYVYLVMPIKS